MCVLIYLYCAIKVFIHNIYLISIVTFYSFKLHVYCILFFENVKKIFHTLLATLRIRRWCVIPPQASGMSAKLRCDALSEGTIK